MERPPNILFLMSDEHRADVAGFAGNSIVRTQVLDELARSGCVFTNAYTPSPACVPARQCLMAGQLPSTCGCRGWIDLPPGHMTFARRLAQWGYMTVCCGKLHMLGMDQTQGFLNLMGMHVTLSESTVRDRDIEAWKRWALSPSVHKWTQAGEVARAGVGRARNARHDEYALQGAINYTEEFFASPYYDRAIPDRPLLLKVSFERPHYPYFTDEARFRYYLNRVHPYVEADAFDHPALCSERVYVGRDVRERDVRRATAAYYGMIEQNDENFGRIMDHLRHLGQNLDDWIIIYCSDHGEMLGQHGVWEKQKFFEGSAHVPLIIRWPRRFAPRVIRENVNLCDLFATLCDLCEVPLPQTTPALDSRSLVPLMHGDSRDWHERHHNEIVCQYLASDLMIKRDALKYQYYDRPDCRERPEVLFDLQADPTERSNLVHEPAYRESLESFRRRRTELEALAGASPGPSAVI